MKRITIKNLQGVVTHQGQAEDPQVWIDQIRPTNRWGLPERVKWKDQCSEEELAEQGVEIQVPTQAYYFIRNDESQEEYFKFEQECSEYEKETAIRVEQTVRTQVTLPAHYTITIEDMQAELDAEDQRRLTILALKQRVRELSVMSDLTAAQVKEALMKLIKAMALLKEI